jgi:hypothetical protein
MDMGTGTNFYPQPLYWSVSSCSTRPEPNPLPSLPELAHKSDIIQDEVVIYFDDIGIEHLTLFIIPNNHILLV